MLHLLLALAALLLNQVRCTEVLGCNGMVKSIFSIDLTRISLHLHTQDDILKFSTECAPNDGYFFIPLSDLEGIEQKISIKLQVPRGWNFDSRVVEIQVDFKTDVCALGQDIIFEFTGFSIEGKVVSYGLETGPQGVSVDLRQGSESVSSTESVEKGIFLFKNIPPGSYSLQGRHPQFNVSGSILEVVVSTDALELYTSIFVYGYDLSGNVFHEKTGIKGVHILLISNKDFENIQSESCMKSIEELESELKQTPMLFCVTESDQNGNFKLSSVPPGDYTVEPTYRNERTKFHLRPELLRTVISHSNVALETSFEVTGFEVYGSVIKLAENGESVGMDGVRVELTRTGGRRLETKSDTSGAYHFSEIEAGAYTVSARMVGFEFDDLSVDLTPTQTEIRALSPSKFEITGKLELKKVSNRIEFVQNTKVEFFSDKSYETPLENNLSFKILLPKGNYKFSPKLTNQLIAKGIIFTPEAIHVTVTNTPLTGFLFSQILSSISVTTHCIHSCAAFNTFLTEKSTQLRLTQATTPDDVTGTVVYRDLLAGEYSVELDEGFRCWRDRVVIVDIGKESRNVNFHQEGFILEISTSHETPVTLTHSSGEFVQDQLLSIGHNQFCLPLYGVYQITPKSCHRFEPDAATFDTSQPRKLQLTAISHLTNVNIRADTSDLASENIRLKVSSFKSGETDTIDPSTVSVSQDNANVSVLEFAVFAVGGDILNIEPVADQLLFVPGFLSVSVKGDSCPVLLGTFLANRGSVVRGKIKPPMEGVLVELRITAPNGEVLSTHTNGEGVFSFGPLPQMDNYEIVPSSPGVQFERREDNVFVIHRMGSVVVWVVDESERPLPSVLVSMHCGRVRMNNLTGDTGQLTYTQLQTCKYYIKPSSKEYSFTPNGEMVEVELDSEIERRFVGHKVQYSAYGNVTSLNGHPQGEIEVVAVGKSDLCLDLEERGVTDRKGEFRILGLKLDCQYHISVDMNHTPRIENVIPGSYVQFVGGEDLRNIRFRMYNRTEQHEMTGNIIGSDEVMDRMQVKLYQETARGLVHISNIQVGPGGFFKFSLPRTAGTEGKEFVLMADSKSRIQGYTISSEQAVVRFEEGRKHTSVKFRADLVSDSGDMKGGSYLYLTLVLIAVAAVSRFSRKIKNTIQIIFGR